MTRNPADLPDPFLRDLVAELAVVGVRAEDLAAVIGRTTPRRLARGDPLCTQGERGEELYFLVEGRILVQRRDREGHPRPLATLCAPAILGHMAVIDGSPRSASCLAVEPCRVLILAAATARSLMREPTPRGAALRRLLLSSLTRQLAAGNARLFALLELGEDVVDVETLSGLLEGWRRG